ncbi:hypothetical protein P153DRAFT_312347 [Dothidotthia symphoricarpi CBS 119687]|uniref:DNA-directed DNA polymerase n=1 Tax=Dothidotthia symphoricarpi CBS 119687 TaxID=1392245 RepID=A0A6A6AID4_9PLEO|nr:uncharacterized protein P153DRAFT_312347 [Dothidotthia symphoricarpi CBS 119687]KAF2131709.1 hypothetical protein P153DRAFT_312347 [Dothidotthia symphoricarpi CBS 119687]
MPTQELIEKEAYFKEQDLLDLTDDETGFPDEGFAYVERALMDSEAMPPPKPERRPSSFLGPTPRERQADFETHAARRRSVSRSDAQTLVRSSTDPSPESSRSFSVTKLSRESLVSETGLSKNIKRVISMPDLFEKNQVPFYKVMGVIPRELKHGKNAKPAENIKLEPARKQLLQGRVVYFYPNDDISMVRRTRIHKVIQLGAAWVTKWRDDITHIMVDDANHTYSQLLRHFNRAGFPRRIILVRFDPYIPQCIQYGTLSDPTLSRFTVKGAPLRSQTSETMESSQISTPTQTSLKIKPSKRQMGVQGSQKTDSIPTGESMPSTQLVATVLFTPDEETIEDSFVMPSEPNKRSNKSETSAPTCNDALSQAIQEAKALAHLPLDEDEDAEVSLQSFVDEDSDSGTDDESVLNSRKKSKVVSTTLLSNRTSKRGFDQSNFQCMNPNNGDLSSQNPNARTIQVLDEMCKYYDKMQDQWRTLAYRKGITTLKKQTTKITCAKQAATLPFIGTRLANKIEEIVLTDRLRKLDSTRDDPLDQVLRLFLGVYGAGLQQANKWIQAGHRTLEDLHTKVKLTDSQKVGVEHYADFNSRIPRAEVEAHGAIVKNALRKIDTKFEATIMGSYRRGTKDSGDIDLIISCPRTSLATLRTVIFETLVPQLFKAGFLKVALATSRSNDSTGTKWHGASCLPSSKTWRRLDLLLVPEGEIGAALLYFTGNDIFNRSMRLLARKKGMRLNQKGLYKDVKRGRRGEKLNEGVLVEGRNEKRIFEVLGVPWREPHERIC